VKLFFSILVTDIHRALCSLRFILSACGVALVILLTGLGLINNANDVIYLLDLSSGSENLMLIVGILPILPFATTFATEWEEHAIGFWIIRTGIGNYAVSKVLVGALSGFLTTAAGTILFVLIALTRLPLFTDATAGNAYSLLLDAGKPVQYLCCRIADISLSSVLFAVAAVWISAYITNKFTAVAGPLVLYFLALRITATLNIPWYLKISAIVHGGYGMGTPIQTLLFKLGIVVVLCFPMGYGAVRRIRRRMFCE